jgi:predicted acylesterase/phospholipase RssA/NAD-dependent dihydropyrimidine dehydrogenase PreA subunit
MPGIFPPRVVRGEQYVDGGVGDNLPISMAEFRKADLIIAVTLGFRGAATGQQRARLRGAFGGFKEIIGSIVRQSSISIRDKVESSLHFCRTPLVLIEVDVSEHDVFDFSNIGRLVERGHRVAREILESNPAILNKARSNGNAPSRWQEHHFSKAKFALDMARCIGCGLCVLACPYDIFRMNGPRAQLIVSNADRCTQDKACQNNCPAEVIKVL